MQIEPLRSAGGTLEPQMLDRLGTQAPLNDRGQIDLSLPVAVLAGNPKDAVVFDKVMRGRWRVTECHLRHCSLFVLYVKDSK